MSCSFKGPRFRPPVIAWVTFDSHTTQRGDRMTLWPEEPSEQRRGEEEEPPKQVEHAEQEQNCSDDLPPSPELIQILASSPLAEWFLRHSGSTRGILAPQITKPPPQTSQARQAAMQVNPGTTSKRHPRQSRFCPPHHAPPRTVWPFNPLQVVPLPLNGH